MDSAERAVRDHHAIWIAAVNSGDLDRLMAMMTDDVIFLHPGRAPFGRDDFPDGFLAAHRDNRIDCRSDLEEVTVVGAVAYSVCCDALTVVPRAGGKTVELAGERLTVYRLQADGRWLLACDANTLAVVAD